MTTVTSTPTGHWALTAGGTTTYCSKGHFTDGPTWKFWVGLVSKLTVCEKCAEKEAS